MLIRSTNTALSGFFLADGHGGVDGVFQCQNQERSEDLSESGNVEATMVYKYSLSRSRDSELLLLGTNLPSSE